jgi:2-polyprenyl-6-methoxyphenol hydroxylase-like FAD-dependent oxidoreductase
MRPGREFSAKVVHVSKVIIIGGGPGGLAAAAALRRVGIDAVVFERAPELREVGAALSLWSNAITALRHLGLDGAVIARGTVIERALTVTADGRLLSDAPLGEIGRSAGAPSVCAHRADLQSVLAERVERIRLGAECVAVEEDDSGVTARLADGRAERGALLIGADGIRSAVRAHLHGTAEPRRAGYVAYRGIARGNLLPETSPDRSRLVLGPGAQAGIFPCGPDRVYWFATAPAPDAPPAGPPGDLKTEALEKFRRWLPLLTAVIGATDAAAVSGTTSWICRRFGPGAGVASRFSATRLMRPPPIWARARVRPWRMPSSSPTASAAKVQPPRVCGATRKPGGSGPSGSSACPGRWVRCSNGGTRSPSGSATGS